MSSPDDAGTPQDVVRKRFSIVVSGKRHYKVMSATGRLLAVIPHGRFSEWLTMRDLFRHRPGKPGATPKRRGAV